MRPTLRWHVLHELPEPVDVCFDGRVWHELQPAPALGCENDQLEPAFLWHEVHELPEPTDVCFDGREWHEEHEPPLGCENAQLLPVLW